MFDGIETGSERRFETCGSRTIKAPRQKKERNNLIRHGAGCDYLDVPRLRGVTGTAGMSRPIECGNPLPERWLAANHARCRREYLLGGTIA